MSGPGLELPTGSVHDFDFLAGAWRVQNRFLRTRLAGDDVFLEFAGSARVEHRLGGLANVDEIEFPTRGLSGMTVRLFDASERRWSIHWTDTRRAVFHPAMRGGFQDGDRGLFYGEAVEGGRTVRARFVWERRDGRPHWEQAFSLDGVTWETNWLMDFSRP